MIHKVRLENWRSHLESEMEFGEGTNALIGIMGSGKSSVLSGISFALFGTFPALRSREVTLDGVIMGRPHEKKEAAVEVIFTAGGERLQVRREIGRGKGTTEAEIRKDDELLDTGASRVTELVEKYLKVDYELFSRAVYSEQDGLDYFLEIPKGQRMKRIDSLLRIDRFEDCRSNTITAINRLKERVESKEDVVSEMEEKENFGKIDELKGKIEDIKEDMDEKRDELGQLDEKYEKIKESLEEVREGMEEVKELKSKRDNFKGVISNIKSDVEDIRDSLDLSREEIESRIEEMEEEIEELEENKDELQGKREETRESKQQRKVKIQELQKRIQELKDLEGRCPVCDSDLTEKHKEDLLEERRTKISELDGEKTELEERENKIERKVEETEDEIEELEDEKTELERKGEKLGELERKGEKLKNRKGELEKIKEKLQKKAEKFDEDRAESKRERLEELSSRRTKMKTEMKSDRRLLEEMNERLEELKEKRMTFQRYKEEIETSRKLSEDLKKFRGALKSTQKQLRERFINAVNNTMSRVWNDLYPYDDFTGVRLTIKEGDYELQMRSAGDWHAVEGVASGGERTTAALALRIAFALVLAPNLRWLVLDEPTHNLDKKTVRDLAELLRTSVSEFVDQVFIITHDENLESAVNSYLYRLDRDKEENEPTQVEKITSV